MIKNSRVFVLFILFFGLFSSCEDPELDALMEDYCECISQSRYEEGMHLKCIEKMDSIKEKYKNQPRKLGKVIEKTDECY